MNVFFFVCAVDENRGGGESPVLNLSKPSYPTSIAPGGVSAAGEKFA